MVNADGNIHCTLVMAKSRLPPIQYMTIPRLKLSAGVDALRMDSLLKGELRLSLEESGFWSDSTTVLHYIRSKAKRFQTFVANIPVLVIIYDGSSPVQWGYIRTKLNPADCASILFLKMQRVYWNDIKSNAASHI